MTMTSKDEGRHEIETVKQRLATAEAQAASAALTLDSAKATEESARKMAEMAKKTMQVAQSQLDGSQREVGEALKCLMEAEKRWDVDDLDSQKQESCKKKRKVSLSLGSVCSSHLATSNEATTRWSNNDSNGSAAYQNNVNAAIVAQSAGTTNITNIRHSNGSNGSSDIIIEGAGTLEVNGIYKRSDRSYGQAPLYSKKGQFRGKTVQFMVFSRNRYWNIGIWSCDIAASGGIHGGYPSATFYRNHRIINTTTTEVPSDYWIIDSGVGTAPAPHCR